MHERERLGAETGGQELLLRQAKALDRVDPSTVPAHARGHSEGRAAADAEPGQVEVRGLDIHQTPLVLRARDPEDVALVEMCRRPGERLTIGGPRVLGLEFPRGPAEPADERVVVGDRIGVEPPDRRATREEKDEGEEHAERPAGEARPRHPARERRERCVGAEGLQDGERREAVEHVPHTVVVAAAENDVKADRDREPGDEQPARRRRAPPHDDRSDTRRHEYRQRRRDGEHDRLVAARPARPDAAPEEHAADALPDPRRRHEEALDDRPEHDARRGPRERSEQPHASDRQRHEAGERPPSSAGEETPRRSPRVGVDREPEERHQGEDGEVGNADCPERAERDRGSDERARPFA